MYLARMGFGIAVALFSLHASCITDVDGLLFREDCMRGNMRQSPLMGLPPILFDKCSYFGMHRSTYSRISCHRVWAAASCMQSTELRALEMTTGCCEAVQYAIANRHVNTLAARSSIPIPCNSSSLQDELIIHATRHRCLHFNANHQN